MGLAPAVPRLPELSTVGALPIAAGLVVAELMLVLTGCLAEEDELTCRSAMRVLQKHVTHLCTKLSAIDLPQTTENTVTLIS
jgi:hypothetical protein